MRKILVAVSIYIIGGLYLVACASPVFIVEGERDTFWIGLACLLLGMGSLPWYANLSLFASVFFMILRMPTLALCTAGAAVLLGLTTLQIGEIPRDEGGNMIKVIGYDTGFYLWMSAHGIALLTSFILKCADLWALAFSKE